MLKIKLIINEISKAGKSKVINIFVFLELLETPDICAASSSYLGICFIAFSIIFAEINENFPTYPIMIIA